MGWREVLVGEVGGGAEVVLVDDVWEVACGDDVLGEAAGWGNDVGGHGTNAGADEMRGFIYVVLIALKAVWAEGW